MRILLALFTLPSLALADPRPSIENRVFTVPAPKRAVKCPRLDLHKALLVGDLACLGTALEHMDVNDRDVNGDTPLHNAIHLRNGKAIRFLVSHGADIHLRDFHGQRPQELAESLNYRRLGDYLAAVERETERLEEAADANDIVAASNSLLRGASLGMRDIRLDTVLHKTAQSGLTEMGRLLIHHGAKLEARNYLGETPLHVAALRDHREFMAMLIEAGANPNAIDERRTTPLDIAAVRADPRILAMLKKSKARRGTGASVEFDFTGGEGAISHDEGSSHARVD